MDVDRRRELEATYRDGLLKDTLPFWITHAVDHQHGGFMTSLGRDGTILDTDKAVWLQGRFTWLLGELYNNVAPHAEWLELAEAGIQFIERFCFDASDGRLWFHLTRDGRPLRKRRYAYSESFVAIAFGELAQATGNDRYAQKAAACFRRFVQHNTSPRGVEPKYADTRPLKSFGFPMITIGTAQELRDSIQLAEANEWIDRSIESIRRHHLNAAHEAVLESVGPSGELIDHFDGRILNPGHALEGAWFILREARHRNDPALTQLGCTMLDWMWNWGWDTEYGGILYYRDVKKMPVQEYWHDMKFWWPQNEAIIATLMAYVLTGKRRYAEWHAMIHDWAYQHFPDPEHGEWYGYLHRDGRISNDAKGNLWKGPFHLPRMQLTCWRLVEEMR